MSATTQPAYFDAASPYPFDDPRRYAFRRGEKAPPNWVCGLCRGEFVINQTLQISWCPIHGIAAPIVRVRGGRP